MSKQAESFKEQKRMDHYRASNVETVAGHLNVSTATLKEFELPVMQMLVSDSFKQHSTRDYRDVAIDRAIESGCNFATEWNTITNFARRFVKVSCPYCGEDTKTSGGGGNNAEMSVSYFCEKCGSITSLTFPANAGISVSPKVNKLEELIPRK